MTAFFKILFWGFFLFCAVSLVILLLPVILIVVILQSLFGVRMIRKEHFRNFRPRWKTAVDPIPDPPEKDEAPDDIPASQAVIDAEAIDLPDDDAKP